MLGCSVLLPHGLTNTAKRTAKCATRTMEHNHLKYLPFLTVIPPPRTTRPRIACASQGRTVRVSEDLWPPGRSGP
jgi:hypothetical protein